MQLITHISKFFILAVVSSSLLIAWNSGHNETTLISLSRNYTVNVDESQPVKPADSIWGNMQRELKLDHQAQSQQVKAEIRKLLADQGKLNAILNAARPYLYFIFKQTQARGLPAEIALIPIIESEFNPNDHSTKGATGLWQLMPGTAQELGVKIKSGYDGRRDVVASTKAALAYFNDLGNNFNGNWYLAIAAYNCGQVRIESAEKRTGSHNFWNLPLPRETKYYVPKLLAVAEIIKNPQKYGVELPPIVNAPYFTQLNMKTPANLEKIAKSSGISAKTLHTLNPDYNHGMVAKKGTYTLLVPVKETSKTNSLSLKA